MDVGNRAARLAPALLCLALLVGCAAGTPQSGSSAPAATPSPGPSGGPDGHDDATGAPSPVPTPTVTSVGVPPGQGQTGPEDGDDATGDTVTPVVTYAGPGSAPGTVEVSGYVPGVESSGVCTVSASALPGVVATSQAEADASTTTCGTLVLAMDPSAGGTVVLEYRSDRRTGASAPAPVSATP